MDETMFWASMDDACYHSMRSPHLARSAALGALSLATAARRPDLMVLANELLGLL